MLGIGVVVWLASEPMFFAGLFAAWFGVRAVNEVWPPDGVELDVPRTAVASIGLVASSFTLHAGERAAHAGDHRREGGAEDAVNSTHRAPSTAST